jgi:flagellar motor switch/type III secretory pathway protein FliN
MNERRTKMEERESDMIEARLDDPRHAGTAGMDVVLRAEVGRVTLTLEQALALVPGRVLGLDRDVGTAVQLMVKEQLIATGELVECGGRLAVEITEVP